jgi:hypothetical protein
MSSLRKHEEDFANFFTGLGLQRRAAKDLAEVICRFAEITDALEELADVKQITVARRSVEGGTDG